MPNISCRAAERAAKRAIQNVAYAEDCTDDARLRALARLAAIINGHLLEIESRQPTPPSGFGEIYI